MSLSKLAGGGGQSESILQGRMNLFTIKGEIMAEGQNKRAWNVPGIQ
jgi:hypothetical protein